MRRRLTVKRIDPWSVLKVGVVANLALLAIGLLVAYVIWFVIERLNIIDQVCGIATDVGFTQCGVNVGNLFRTLVLLGLLGVVVATAVWVFLAFLHNLIADLTGGFVFTMVEDTRGMASRAEADARAGAVPPPRPRPDPAKPSGHTGAGRAAEAPREGRAVAAPRGGPRDDTATYRDTTASSRAGGEELFGGR